MKPVTVVPMDEFGKNSIAVKTQLLAERKVWHDFESANARRVKELRESGKWPF